MGKNIALVGFMGTGKSAVGRILARKLDREFIDMDTLIETRAGKAISAIFADEGEPAFRALERALVQELSAAGDRVIATGGGVVLNPDNLADFDRNSVVVCLLAQPETILERVARDTHRPLLEGDADKAAAIRELLAKRQSLYEAIPLQVVTDHQTAQEVAQKVLALCGRETRMGK